MNQIFLVLFYFIVPYFILYFTHKSDNLKKIGAIIQAYIIGLLLGNIGIFPKVSDNFTQLLGNHAFLPKAEVEQLFKNGEIIASDLVRNQIGMTQDIVMTIVIPLAIPLLLFSLDIKSSFKHLKSGLGSLLIAIVSLLISIVIGHVLFANHLPESYKISGMMVGLYTGGTPNLAALASALDVAPNIFILTHTYDLIIGILLLFFFITSAQKLLNKFLPHFKESSITKVKETIKQSEPNDYYISLKSWETIKQLLVALVVSVGIFAIGGGLSLLVPQKNQMAVVILTITTFGILLSLVPRIHQLEKTFELGMYLILVFSITVSSMADISTIFQIEFLNLFLYVIIAVFGSMLIHIILSKIFKIDTDTTIITITALSTSPPFVPIVAGALKNKNIIILGITIGVIGYAIGNYLGLSVAYILDRW